MKVKIITLLVFLLVFGFASAQKHPCLTLTQNGIKDIKANLGKVPLYDKSLKAAIKSVDAEIAKPIEVPVPKDMAGGFTHETDRKNRIFIEKDFKSPFLIDIFKVNASTENTLDLPLYYLGQVMSQNFSINRLNELKKLGNKNGYQHIWKEAEGVGNPENSSLTWLNAGVFHTYITATTAKDSIFMGRIGASDPNFNLRPEPVMILRRKAAKLTKF